MLSPSEQCAAAALPACLRRYFRPPSTRFFAPLPLPELFIVLTAWNNCEIRPLFLVLMKFIIILNFFLLPAETLECKSKEVYGSCGSADKAERGRKSRKKEHKMMCFNDSLLVRNSSLNLRLVLGDEKVVRNYDRVIIIASILTQLGDPITSLLLFQKVTELSP